MEAVDKVLAVPAIDMTDGSAQGRGIVVSAPKAETPAQKKRGRPQGSRNTKPSRRARPVQTTRSAAAPATSKAGTSGLDGADIEALARDLVANVEALTQAVRAQGREVGELRLRVDGVRGILD